jgi:hypothetical protein
MHPVLLRLPPALERAFAREYFQQSLAHHRIVLLIGLVIFAVFGILDRLTIPDVPAELWVIRYGVVCPLIFGVLALTFAPAFERHLRAPLNLAMLTYGLGLVFMGVVAPPPANHTFYVGLCIALIAFHTLVRVPFTDTALVTWTIIAVYEVAAIWLKPLTPLVLLNNTFFLVAANLVGLFAAYSIERHARTDFLQRRVIEAERKQSELLLLNILPAPIAERLKQSAGTIADSFPRRRCFSPTLSASPPSRTGFLRRSWWLC